MASSSAQPVQSQPGHSLGIPSVPNLRDLGGYPGPDGSVVRTGLVYRSDRLSGITPEDVEKVEALGLKTDFDLRTAEERERHPDRPLPHINSVWLDVLADADKGKSGPVQLDKLLLNPAKANVELGGGRIVESFERTYREFVWMASARHAYGQLMVALGNRALLPAVFHCSTGKDRTGWAAAILLSILGVAREVIMQDFLRSNDYIPKAYQRETDAFLAAGGDPSIPPAIFGVKPEYLDAAFDEVATRYGTMERYVSEGLAIDADEQAALRELYLVRPGQH